MLICIFYILTEKGRLYYPEKEIKYVKVLVCEYGYNF
jgi:hypothetical protein